MDEQSPALGQVIRAFAIAQVVVILIPIVLLLVGIDLGSSSNLVGSFVAAMYAAQKFVKLHGRAPASDERRRLAWLSLAVSWAISLAFVALFIAFTGPAGINEFGKVLTALPLVAIAVIVLVVCGLGLAVFYVAYGPLARRFERQLAVK